MVNIMVRGVINALKYSVKIASQIGVWCRRSSLSLVCMRVFKVDEPSHGVGYVERVRFSDDGIEKY